ncbi:membrane protein [Rhodococcus ruber Chol-4]|uniref:PH domain-containing protein n=1 Tax=Rhodococcus TaxID=1827 RepID=UPI00034C1150|nr:MULTISPECIES: PH domain-containing protein [Rhodococcus]AXY49494.1 membrane protein [Rhodococcus ruber]KXF84054.1 membrane protein [Rhodococcus ruber Chol-4]MDO1480840.1 PH domain-containing protein [Rhodococcus ruber]UQB72931.1 PH domain-containing protein [Rhodococcus ruber]WML62824.1 PH domain-containing protein [Rhodococcus sp. AH-ZY2]
MSGEQPLRWSTPPLAIVALAVGGVVLAVAAATTPDPAGRTLVGLAAAVALVVAALAARQRPRLEVLPEGAGLAVTRLTGRRELPRAALTRVRIVAYPRLGRRVPMLEIDVRDTQGDEHLLIFGRWDLGTDPRTVYDALAVRGLAPDQTPS